MSEWTRAEHIRRLETDGPFDVTVVGGGVIGTGTALDLAARGLSVALLERSDFAQGTSSRSTKLFHGGIRYLPQMHFRLVSEGLREQKVLARIADFLYHPLEFVVPLYEQYGIADAPAWAASGWRAPMALRAGLALYDFLGGFGRPGARHRKVDAASLEVLMPRIKTDGLRGGFVYSDAQTDDARLVLTLAKTAVHRFGAVAVGRAEVTSIRPESAGFTVVTHDRLGGNELAARSRTVVFATGAFTPPGVDHVPPLELTRSKGTHLIAGPGTLGLDNRALVLPETDDGRVMYIVPWLGHSMIGTTDTTYTADPAHPVASPEDVDYLVRHVKRYLDVPSFEPLTAFAGLRALKASDRATTSSVSREHVIEQPKPGLIQVAGGKLTTYRRIAAEVADHAAQALGNDKRSTTATVPLIGSGGMPDYLIRRLAAAGFRDSTLQPTVDRYGTDIELLARLAEEEPALTEPLTDGRASLADAAFAIRHEGAATISDVTLRRTHTAWFTPDHGRRDAPRIAEVMAEGLGWSESGTAAHLADHERELIAEGL